MKTTVEIQNLKCSGCESTIAKKLISLKNIKNVSVNLSNCNVSFSYETDDGLETVKNELSKLGYPLKGEENKLPKKAKSYISCAIGKLNK